MKCPVCQKHFLRKHHLEADLPAHKCKSCAGIWVPALQYWEWLKGQDDVASETFTDEAPIPLEEASQARLCPDCGRLLRRYKIWPDVQFYLDRCGHCTSVWFDQGEWAALKSRNLHRQIHTFFTDIWQRGLRDAETRKRFIKMYQERFGDDYARLKEIREWLEQHPKRGEFLAYLSDKDPYRPLSNWERINARGT